MERLISEKDNIQLDSTYISTRLLRDKISRVGGAPQACARDAAHMYREKSSSGMMQLWPLQFNNRYVKLLAIIF
jgi:hypothetical protein